jgi:hypothetical protein
LKEGNRKGQEIDNLKIDGGGELRNGRDRHSWVLAD